MKKYFKHKLKDLIVINKIVTIHYFEFDKDFSYDFEKHNFWEIVYTDKNDLICSTESGQTLLTQGNMIFYKPDFTHAHSADGKQKPKVFIISFECHSEAMHFFEDKVITLTPEQVKYLYLILNQAKLTFDIPYSDPNLKKMKILPSPTLGGEQIIKNLLELLLIDIMKTQTETIQGNNTFISEFELGNKLIKDIKILLKENIYSNISIDYICQKTHYSKSYIFKQFKKQTGKTIIEYYVNLKINEAKKLLRQNVYSINEIADKLCFDTPNYFSKTFKKISGITPTMYKKMNTKL
ncbi:MAG: helix-turn-helix transcriptional regulator [Clostridiales bacterium]|nr:helix-turn-helix transcriptional regulator [Clostridiales bacterium]